MKFLKFNTLFLLVFLSGFGEAQGREVAEGESPQNEQCESLFCKLVQLRFGEVQEQDVIPSFDFVTIPAKGAEFKMGSPKGEPKRCTNENGKDGEQVDVTFTKDFEIMKYEVTQEEYFMVTGTNPSHFNKKRYCQGEGEYVEKTTPNGMVGLCRRHPVESVSWDMGMDFIKELNKRAGFKEGDCTGNPTKDKTGCYRYPTEAEWEFAARGGTDTAYSFGNNPEDLKFYGWYRNNSKEQTQPVGDLDPNPYGLFDMHGNVWEWTQNSWQNFLVGEEDPLHTDFVLSIRVIVIRGGSWFSVAQYLRSAYRYYWFAGNWNRDIGFRLVRTL